ncbi:hypothetical protein O0L34_g3861 [Tuta absoluta]|nr:hypothetical protein O0L34_g3861 [Tuta absoluta]
MVQTFSAINQPRNLISVGPDADGLFVTANPDVGLKKSYYDISKAYVIFKEFQEKYHKKYLNNKEFNRRFLIFKKSLEDINRRNEDSDGEVYGITEFSDMTLDEFLREHTGFKSGLPPNNNTKILLASQSMPSVSLPENWDWRSHGVVTPVRHQGYCQSCWSFSAVGCVEGQYAKKYGVLLTLSDQQLVDCYKKTCNYGDWPHEAFRATAKMGGFMLAQDYPYTSIYGRHGQCKFKKDKVYVKVKNGTQYRVNDEDHLKNFLHSYGPVALGLFVTANPDVGLKKSYYDISKANVIFKEFQEKYHKKYLNNKEFNRRFLIFKKSLEDINRRNEDSDGEVYGITEFSDMTLDEFLREHTGFKSGLPPNNNTKILLASQSMPSVSLPENWDWRSHGVVTPVRHQGYCQSCWSFSAVGCVEGQYAKKYGVLLTLSDQQLVDCYKKTCNYGDWPHEAFRAAAKMGGFMLAKDYPYTSVYGRHGQCKFKKDKVYVKVKNGTQYKVNDEDHLKNFLHSYGPVALGINTGMGFLYYRGGIASARHLGCRPGHPINHAVLLVGYGIENGVPFWIIKNSAGKEWGEEGFIRIRRGENTCNILSYVAAAEIE